MTEEQDIPSATEQLPTEEEKVEEKEETKEAEKETEEVKPSGDSNVAEYKEGEYEGIQFDTGAKFRVPKMWGPVLGSASHWTIFHWLGKLSTLNLLLPLLHLPNYVLIAWFMLWRVAYDFGIGFLLRWQSNSQGMTKLAQRVMDMDKDSRIRKMFKDACTAGRTDYDFENSPACLNAWVGFRLFEDIILSFDLFAYFGFALSNINAPESWSISVILTYVLGFAINFFSLWAKMDSYRVIKDYAWYWGDFFFLVKANLTFDRVFMVAPHPMYTLGYLFFYGSAMIARSYTVLYVSLLAHALQLVFLALFETPHMKKIYPEMVGEEEEEKQAKKRAFFGKDLLLFKNFSPFRFGDLALAVIVAQTVILYAFLPSSPRATAYVIVQALLWRFIHTVVLGYLLRQQSQHDTFVRAFEARGFTRAQAFDYWKELYNLTHTMTFVSFFVCALQVGTATYANYYVMQTLGVLLCLLAVLTYKESYEVVGEYGWFYGDFFIPKEDISPSLYYTGVFRFMDNPDSIVGYAGFYGLALFFESSTLAIIALLSQLANFGFVVFVERPHMRKIYGENLRPASGIGAAFDIVLGDVLEKNPRFKEWSTKAQDEFDRLKQKMVIEIEKLSDKDLKRDLLEKSKALTPRALLNFLQTKSSSSSNDAVGDDGKEKKE